MVKGKLTGRRDPDIKPIPISLEDRPKLFSLIWLNSVVNYCLDIISTLSALFRLRSSTIEVAYYLNVPEKYDTFSSLCITYFLPSNVPVWLKITMEFSMKSMKYLRAEGRL